MGAQRRKINQAKQDERNPATADARTKKEHDIEAMQSRAVRECTSLSHMKEIAKLDYSNRSTLADVSVWHFCFRRKDASLSRPDSPSQRRLAQLPQLGRRPPRSGGDKPHVQGTQ